MPRWRSNSGGPTVHRYKVSSTTTTSSPAPPRAPRRTTYAVGSTGTAEVLVASGSRPYDVIEHAANNNMALVYKKDWTRERAEREYVPTAKPGVVVQKYERPVVRYERPVVRYERPVRYEEMRSRERERYLEPPPIGPLPRQEVMRAKWRHRSRSRTRSYSRSRSVSRDRSHGHYRRHTIIHRRGSSSDCSYYSGGERHHKRTLTEGALAGAGITALMQSRRDSDGELPENRGSKVIAGAALGALGAEALRRAQSSHPHERPSLRSALGVGAAALALAGTATMMKTRRDEIRGRSRSRFSLRRRHYSPSRSRSGSRSRSMSYSSRESSLERRPRRRSLSLRRARSHSMAKIAAGTAGATALAHRIRHRSRSRRMDDPLSDGYDSYDSYSSFSDDGRRRHHRGRHKLAKLAAGTAATAAISRRLSRSRSQRRSYSSSPEHGRRRHSLAKIAMGTAATALVADKLRHRSRDYSSESESYSSDGGHRHRRKRPSVAKIAAGSLAAGAIAKKLSRSRSRSRSLSRRRSHSKLQTGAEIAGAGAVGLGAAKLFNKVRHRSSSRTRERNSSRFSLRRKLRRRRDRDEEYDKEEEYYSDDSLSDRGGPRKTRRELELEIELERERAKTRTATANTGRLVDPNPTFSVVSLPEHATNPPVHETITREVTEVVKEGSSGTRKMQHQLEYDNAPPHIPGIPPRATRDRVDMIPALSRERSRSRSAQGRPLNFRRQTGPPPVPVDDLYDSFSDEEGLPPRRSFDPPGPRKKKSHTLRNLTAATIGAGAAAIGMKKLHDERERSRSREREILKERDDLERELEYERERASDFEDLAEDLLEEDRGRSRMRDRDDYYDHEEVERWSDRSPSRERGVGEDYSPERERGQWYGEEDNVPPSQREPPINESLNGSLVATSTSSYEERRDRRRDERRRGISVPPLDTSTQTLATPSQPSSALSLAPSDLGETEKGVVFVPMSPKSSKTLVDLHETLSPAERNRREAQNGMDLVLAKTEEEDKEDDVEELPERFDKAGRPLRRTGLAEDSPWRKVANGVFGGF